MLIQATLTRARRAAPCLTGALLLITLSVAPSFADENDPGFAIRLMDDSSRHYAWPPGASTLTDEYVEASIAKVDADEWELTVRSKDAQLKEVWFPWQPEQYTLNPDVSDDVIFYPVMMGFAQVATSVGEWDWKGWEYPGLSHAAMVVIADGTKSKLVAATCWPPRRVLPMFSLNRLSARYEDPQPAATTRKYRTIIAEFVGDAAIGSHPWHAAVDRYRTWLQAKMTSAGLAPVPYTDQMWATNGWLSCHLQDQHHFKRSYWDQWHARWAPTFPWMQFWGQMSNYSGPVALAEPPLRRGEKTGCCLDNSDMHLRYLPGLPRFIRDTRAQGTLVGLYARPRDPYEGQDLGATTPVDGKTNAEFFAEWGRRNREVYGANAAYLDTVGNLPYGDGLFVAELIRDEFQPNVVVEGVVDIYPCAYLLSGMFQGGVWGGGPDRSLEGLGDGYTTLSYPAFGRYLLNDRIVFVGENNYDRDLWGPSHDHWIERQAFLLGAKLDVIHPNQLESLPLGPMNTALEMIVAEWDRVGWWNRRPTYLDRSGIHGVPVGIDVRRFRGKDGETLFAVENWQQQTGKSFQYLGSPIEVSDARLSIIVVE